MTTSGEWPLTGAILFCRLNRLITHRQSRRAPFGRASPARSRFAPAAARSHRARAGRDFPAAAPAAAAFVQGGWQRLSSDDLWRASRGDVVHSAGMNSAVVLTYARAVILFVAIVVLSMMRGQPHFAPRPTGPMPAVSIP